MTRRPLPLARVEDLLLAERGLSPAEIAERRRLYGANEIVETRSSPLWDLVRDTATDPMVWFLIVTALLYGFLGQVLEAAILGAAIIPLVGMDAFLHRRAQASTSGLKSRLATIALVVRDGPPVEIPTVDIVPGDLVVIIGGEAFPADGIITAGTELQADESTLTGEAFPVRKRPLVEPPKDGTEPAVDSEHWGFAGTRLLTGQATMRVVFTGQETVYGEIVRSAAKGVSSRTPLQVKISRLVAILIAAACATCLVLALVRLHQGYGWIDALVSAVTLAIAALPEEFPVVFTFYLGVGVYRLAKRQALVRRAVAVENIGRVSSICSDKTGTITEGRFLMAHLLPATGITPERLHLLGAIASRGESGDPLDLAILREPPARFESGCEQLAVFPFTETRKRETAVIRESGRIVAAVKGAPETVFALCALDSGERESWGTRLTELATQGHKLIACAWRELDDSWRGDEPGSGYRFAGLLAFEDPVRPGVAQAIDDCGQAGIHVIMITGDHPITARAVAKEIGLGSGKPVLISADEMEDRIRRDESESLSRVDVIARAVPAQKLALVRALHENGQIVAVTGDGINDVPALQAADIGIAMGERGSRSAREIASIVLLDDNFRTIVGAISEGRQLFRNLKLSFQYLLTIHMPFIVTAALIPLAGYPLLFLPIHIVWLEMIIHPTALLVFQELPAPGGLEPARRAEDLLFYRPGEWALIGAVGVLVTIAMLAGFVYGLRIEGQVEYGRAIALVILTFASALMTAALSGLRTRTSRVVVAVTFGLSLIVVQVPSLAAVVHVKPLHMFDWLSAGGSSLLAVALPMLWASRKRKSTPSSSSMSTINARSDAMRSN
jgi:Ca2+-transporting ATPase